MRVLALDTTTRAGSVAVIEDGRVLVERAGDPSRTHAERLPAEVLDALAEARLTTADIDLFAVTSGPGSFTGIRIGIATMQGLAFVHGKPVAPVSALRALGEAAADGLPVGARAGAWMDAHRHDVFSALYEVAQPDAEAVHLTEVEHAMVGAPAATIARWAASGPPRAICGDGAALYAALLPPAIVVVPTPPLASIVGRIALTLARQGAVVSAAGVQPLYVRRPDAEIARDAAARKP